MRLTEKNAFLYKPLGVNEASQTRVNHFKYVDMYNKLAELENIEEELDIDLITLFKAQTDGFYVKTACGIFSVLLSEWKFNLIKKEVHRIQFSQHYYFKDYGKTWALTKEELL